LGSKSSHFTGSENYDAHILKFKDSGKFIEGTSKVVGFEIGLAQGLKILDTSVAMFAGNLKGINDIEYSDSSRSFFIMKIDLDANNQVYSCIDLETISSRTDV
jgi:hypothetical protein